MPSTSDNEPDRSKAVIETEAKTETESLERALDDLLWFAQEDLSGAALNLSRVGLGSSRLSDHEYGPEWSGFDTAEDRLEDVDKQMERAADNIEVIQERLSELQERAREQNDVSQEDSQ
jgi:hypothetical protein